MSRAGRAPGVLIALLLAGLSGRAAASEIPPGTAPYRLEGIPANGGARRELTAFEREGIVYVAVPEVTQLLGVDYAWWSDLGKLTLFLGRRTVWVLEGSEIAALDDGRLIQLPGVCFLWDGRIHVPLDLLVDERGQARPWIGGSLTWVRRERLLAAAPYHSVEIRDLDVVPDPAGWRLVVRAGDRLTWRVMRSDATSMAVLLEHATHDPFLVPVPGEHPWFQGLRLRRLGEDVELSFTPSAGALGFRVRGIEDGRAVEILLGFEGRDLAEGRLRPFTGGGPAAPGAARVVVLDPGHADRGGGGDDEAGVALEIARLVRDVLGGSLGLEVALTREDVGNPGSAERADLANRVGGDLFVSIHLHGRTGGPVAFVASPEGTGQVPHQLAELGFRSTRAAQEPHRESSRLLARCLLEGLRAVDPASRGGILEEALVELRSAAMPAVLLEIPLGDGPPDAAGRRTLADGIAEGVRLYLNSGAEY